MPGAPPRAIMDDNEARPAQVTNDATLTVQSIS